MWQSNMDKKEEEIVSLTKADLVSSLSNVIGINLREAKEIVEAFFEEISLNLARGEEVRITGLGNFVVRNKKERPGRNPKTGVSATISARKVIKFYSGNKLKSTLKDKACR